MERQAFEPTGLVPRSIIRTFDRFRQQLLLKTKAAAIQEFRISRYQVLVSLKCLISLITIPFFLNLLAKTFLLTPTIEYVWNIQQNEIFLNSYQEDRALLEMQDFSEETYFESLLEERTAQDFTIAKAANALPSPPREEAFRTWGRGAGGGAASGRPAAPSIAFAEATGGVGVRGAGPPQAAPLPHRTSLTEHPLRIRDRLQERFQEKALKLAVLYNKESTLAIINLFGDLVTCGSIALLFVWMKPQIIILKSFLTESLYSLSDTTKSFLLILVTDLLVGFHSPRGWEIAIEVLLRHFGLPENQDFIFLFVAAFPVFLDTIFKYWIFRYLNKISPSTVATYHNMIE